MRFMFVFCSKRMMTIKEQKSPSCFDLIPLNNADIVLL